MIKKYTLIIFILLFLVLQFSFINAACTFDSYKCDNNKVMHCSVTGEWTFLETCLGPTLKCLCGKCVTNDQEDLGSTFMNLIGGEICGNKEGIKYDKIGENKNRFTFTGNEASLNVLGSNFENIAPKDKSGLSSFIEVNALGNITKADFLVNGNGGDYLINGINFHAPSNSRVYYDSEKGFQLSDGTKITSIKELNGQKISGTNINFLDNLNLNGKLEMNKDGYLVRDGNAIYSGMKVSVDSRLNSQGVLIVTNSNSKLNYNGNWIKKTSNGLDIQSIKDGGVSIEFLKDNGIFNMGDYGRLKMNIENGDGLKILKTNNVPEILHKSSETGFTKIFSGDSEVFLNKKDIFWSESGLGVDNILAGQYKSVPYSVVSDSANLKKDSFVIDSYGKGIFKTASGVKDVQTQFSKEVLGRLNNQDLTGIAQILKDNTKDESTSYGFLNNRLPQTLDLASNAGFSKDQSVQLFNGIIKSSKDNSYMIFDKINGNGFNPGFLMILKVNKDNSDKVLETMLKTVKSASDVGRETSLGSSNEILFQAIDNKINLDLTADYIDKAYKLNSKTDGFDILESDFLIGSLKEYDGSNFINIKQGISLSKKYGLSGSLAEDFNLHMTSINNEETLAKEYARAINEKISNGIDSNKAIEASNYINVIHTNEDSLYKTDKIRKTIAADLTDSSKYYLMAYTVGGVDNMFSSTYDALYSALPSNFVNEIKSIDPNGENVAAFAMHAAEMGKLDEFVKQDSNYFINAIKENLAVSEDKKLKSAGSFLANSLIDYYNNPEYKSEKGDMEKFLVDKFNTANSAESKATYGYLLKLDENTNNPDVLKITNTLPAITNTDIPQKWLDRSELSGTLYFYGDENAFGSSINDFQKTYGMSLVKNGENSAILTQKVGDKTIKFDLELTPPTQKPNNQEIIESDKDILVAHRGHSYHLEATFSGQSLTDKILYLGSCSSYSAVPSIQQEYPNAQLISVQGTGMEDINNAAIYAIFKNIASGESSWEEIAPIVDKYAKNTKLVFPNNPSVTLNQYITSAIHNGFIHQ